MKKYVRAYDLASRDDMFQSDLNSAIYNAIAETVEKYSDLVGASNDPQTILEHCVESAVDFWSVHYFESGDFDIE